MADVESFEKLKASQQQLKASLEQSTALSSAIHGMGSRLDDMKQRLPCLEAEIRPITLGKCGYFAIRDQINGAIGPAAAVLKVYDVVRELETSLSCQSCSDLPAYLSLTKRLEEVLRFLADNCGLAIQWLQDIAEFLEGNAFVNDQSLLNVKKALRILQKLHGIEGCAHLDGGLLNHAFNKLETEFSSLLMENSATTTCINASSQLAAPIIQKLQAIVERLNAADRLERCILLYIEARSSNARGSLQALDLDYLEIKISYFEDTQSIDTYIDQWGKHLEFVVKNLLEFEYKLCNNVFEKIGSDTWKRCVARMAEEFRLISFLQFGTNVTKMKKDPIKLLKLLDMFAVLENLRLSFNRLFGGKACSGIQTLTRDLIKRVVDGACEIFWDLPRQVELQRRFSPPSDGGIPGLVSFITNYCNELLGDDYRPILIQVLRIHQSWKQDVYDDELLSRQMYSIMKEIGSNLDAWSKAYEDMSLSYLFMMNNHCHFSRFRGTKLGDIMGDSWLGAHEQYKDYYAALYLRESWGKLLLPLLSQKGTISSPVGKETDHQESENKKRLKAFNEDFEERYKKHLNWVISDESLRQKVCQLLVQAVVPVYRSYVQNYGVLVEQDASARKYVKHTAQSLEKMLSSLFQPKLGKYCSTKGIRLIGKLKNVVTNQICVTLKAM